MLETLTAIGGDPNPLFLVAEIQDALAEVGNWRKANLRVIILRGSKMRTIDGLFDEISAALQFPYYFGENWAAFDECLSDLEWIGDVPGLVLLVLESQLVLSQSDRDLPAFLRAVESASSEYASPIELDEWWDRPAIPFHLVFQSNDAVAAFVRDRTVNARIKSS